MPPVIARERHPETDQAYRFMMVTLGKKTLVHNTT